MLIDLLARGAAAAPDRELVSARQGDLTYAECRDRAALLAQGCLAHGIARAGCAVSDPRDLVALLCASSQVGVELCVFPELADAATAKQLAIRFGHRTVITDRNLIPFDGIETIAPEELADCGPTPTRSDASPVLILTTGTTGTPKAARHDWARLARAALEHQIPEGARWLLAYNLSQFAGIQVLVHVLASVSTLVVPRSRQPGDAIAAMTDGRVTHASATPTFWRLVSALLDDAAASKIPMEQITLGGEPVPSALLQRLARLFPAARVSQVYASTEFGSAISVTDGENGLPLSALDRNENAQVRFRIVGGELQACSRIGMLGYHGEEDVRMDWRPTGDLVEVREDRIHFVGRSTDVVNVGGAKVHPLPVEERVAMVGGVRLARAYGRSNPVTGQIMAVDVVALDGVDHLDLERKIRDACSNLGPAAQPRLIRFVEELELRGDKLDRSHVVPGE